MSQNRTDYKENQRVFINTKKNELIVWLNTNNDQKEN